MLDEQLRRLVMRVVSGLAEGRFGEVAALTGNVRMSEAELKIAVQAHPQAIGCPPDALLDGAVDIVTVSGAGERTMSVWVNLWTKDGYPGDLQLRLTIRREANDLKVELDDLRVP